MQHHIRRPVDQTLESSDEVSLTLGPVIDLTSFFLVILKDHILVYFTQY